MAFPYPAADSLFPMDHLLSFDVSLTIPKNIRKMIYAAFSPITAYIRGYSLYSRVHRDVCIIQNCWTIPCLESDSYDSWPSICLDIVRIRPFSITLKIYIRNHWDIEKREERIESTETIVHCFQNYTWVCIPLSLWSTIVFFPSLPLLVSLLSEWWRIEVVEAQVGDSVSPVCRRAVRGCHL